MRTASTVTAQQTAQKAAPQTTTVQDLIPSVDTEDLSTFADATPMKTARLGRFVTQETWTEMATTRSVFRMVVISWMITALATMLFVTSLTTKTASIVTISPADQVASKTATVLSSSLSAAMMAMTIFVVVTLTQTVQLVTFASVMLMAFAAVLKTLGATTTTACALDLMPPATTTTA